MGPVIHTNLRWVLTYMNEQVLDIRRWPVYPRKEVVFNLLGDCHFEFFRQFSLKDGFLLQQPEYQDLADVPCFVYKCFTQSFYS